MALLLWVMLLCYPACLCVIINMMTSKEKLIRVQDVMTTEVISIGPNATLAEAAMLLHTHGFSGLPVVDEHNVLKGILTEYDFISSGFAVHLPTVQIILEKFVTVPEGPFAQELEKIASLRVRDVMNKEPMTLLEDVPLAEAVLAFQAHHRVNPIPVVDASNKVVGIVSRFDILKIFRSALEASSAHAKD